MLKKNFTRVDSFLDRVWPPKADAKKNDLPNWQLFFLTLAAGLFIGSLIREAPFLGYDWFTLFYRNQATSIYYPPWTATLLAPFAQLPWRLGLALVNGITIATVALMTYQQGSGKGRWRLLSTFMALFSLQTFVVLWVGHIDGIALLGIWAMPWAVPLLLMKSTFIGVAVFTRKNWFLAAITFALLSLLLWPGWPAQLISTLDFRNEHPSAGGWRQTGYLPLVLGIALLLKSKRRDLFQTLAAGAIFYPFILPYHHIVLLPALGRLKGLRLFLAWLAAWLMLVPVITESHFWIYFVFPLAIWFFRHGDQKEDKSWLKLFGEIRAEWRKR